MLLKRRRNDTLKRIIIYPPTVDWDHLHQRPQQLIKALSRRDMIGVFGNINFGQQHPPGLEFITDTLILANNMLLNDIFNKMRGLYPNSEFTVVYSYPDQVSEVHAVGVDRVIFDSLDEPINEFAHWMLKYESAVTQADLVLASSDSLLARAAQYRNDVELVPNGCDYDHFSKVQGSKADPFHIGFVGAVASWLDWELIGKISELPAVRLTFIGPNFGLDRPSLHRSNITYLGHHDYDKLPSLMECFDTLLIPFKLNEMTRGVSPIKFWEYLATGKPIISTALPEVVQSGLATIIDHENYATAGIDHSSKAKKQRIAYAKANSWDERAARICKALK